MKGELTLGLIIILVMIGLSIYFTPRMIRYFRDDFLIKISVIIALVFNFFLAIYIASIVRQLFILPEGTNDSLLIRGGQIDNAYIWISFSLVILFCYMANTFYQKKFRRRFLFLSSIQVIFISLIRFFYYYLNNELNIETALYTWGGTFLGVLIIILNQITDDTGIREYVDVFFREAFR